MSAGGLIVDLCRHPVNPPRVSMVRSRGSDRPVSISLTAEEVDRLVHALILARKRMKHEPHCAAYTVMPLVRGAEDLLSPKAEVA